MMNHLDVLTRCEMRRDEQKSQHKLTLNIVHEEAIIFV